MKPTVPKSFCLMPWMHTHVTSQGFRKLCCLDNNHDSHTPALQGRDFEEYWNSAEVKAARLEMLSGTLPKRCVKCADEVNRPSSYKDDVLAQYPGLAEKAIAATASDGSTTMKPFSFDLRTNVCNFKCRTCGPHSSTGAESELYRSAEIRAVGEHGQDWDDRYRERRAVALKRREEELFHAIEEGRLRHIYWAGGEPLLDEAHWRVMGALADRPEARLVEVVYNTNLSVLSFGTRSVVDLWPRFGSIYVQASVDGLGMAGEYVRSGFKSAIFARNVERVLALARSNPVIQLRLDLTLTSIGLLHLDELLRFALERRIDITAKLMEPRTFNSYMAVQYLPTAVKDDWCRKWIDWIAACDPNGHLTSVSQCLELALSRPSVFEPGSELQSHQRSVIKAFEASREEAGAWERLTGVDERLNAWL